MDTNIKLALENKNAKIPNKKMIQTDHLLSNDSSQTVYWLNDDEIIYVSINKYYNDSSIYVYHVLKKKHTLVYKTKPGFFIDVKLLNSSCRLYKILLSLMFLSFNAYG